MACPKKSTIQMTINEDFLTDAEAVKLGYVSISILDYELLDPNFNSLEFENFINE